MNQFRLRALSRHLVIFILAVFVVALSVPVQASDTAEELAAAEDQAAILAVIDRFFKAMTEKDTETWKEILLDEGVTHRFQIEPDGSSSFQAKTNAQNIKELASDDAHVQERIWDPWVLIRGPLAIVWAPYDFYLDGQLSHCGINAFELLKIEGEWKIGNTSWTAEMGVCEEDLSRPERLEN